MTWLHTTRQLLANRPRKLTLRKLARESGLPLWWLLDFSRGNTDNPGIARVNQLHDHLQARSDIAKSGEG